MSGRPQRVANIEILRGLAAMLVVMCHAVYSTWWSDPGFSLPGRLNDFGPIGLDLFFVISGFIIAHTALVTRRRGPVDFARRRLWRVFPLYLLVSAPWLAIAALEGPLQPGRVLASLTLWPVTGRFNEPYLAVGWTLSFELLFYAAAMACLWQRGWRMVAGLLAGYGLCWIGASWTGAPLLVFLGNPIIVEFLLGVAIAYLAPHCSRTVGMVALLVGLVAISGTLLSGYGLIHSAGRTIDGSQSLLRLIYWGLPCACIVLGAVAMPDWLSGALAKPFLLLGAASYAIYLVHPLVLYGAEALLRSAPIVPPAPLIFWTALILSAAAGLLVHRYVERPLLAASTGAVRPLVATSR